MPTLARESQKFSSRLEDELVLLCSRTNIDQKTSERINQITASANEFDWDYFFQTARRHSVIPLVYPQLSASAAANVPPDQLARFKITYQKNLARNLLLTAELCHILQIFKAAGIEAVPYKGPALAIYAYGNLALRRFVDLDILVRKLDVLKAKEILAAQGFVCDTPWTATQQDLLMRTQHNLPLSREAGRLIVELHWEVAPSRFASSLQAEEFWQRLDTMRINEAVVKCLSAEDLLLSLTVHGSKHLWERLAWICDIAELVKTRSDLNWNLLLKHATSTGNERMLYLGLYLASRLMDVPLPEQVRLRINADKTVASLANEVSTRIFNRDGLTAISIGRNFRFNWAVRSGWRSRLRYFQLLLQPTDADIKTMPLPRAFNFAYYLMRPFGLFRRDRARQDAVLNAARNQ